MYDLFRHLIIAIILSSVLGSSSNLEEPSRSVIEYMVDSRVRAINAIASSLIAVNLVLSFVISCRNATTTTPDNIIRFVSPETVRLASLALTGSESVGLYAWMETHKHRKQPWRAVQVIMAMRMFEFVLSLLIDSAQPCSFIDSWIHFGMMLSLFVSITGTIFLDPPPSWYENQDKHRNIKVDSSSKIAPGTATK